MGFKIGGGGGPCILEANSHDVGGSRDPLPVNSSNFRQKMVHSEAYLKL